MNNHRVNPKSVLRLVYSLIHLKHIISKNNNKTLSNIFTTNFNRIIFITYVELK